MRSATRLGRMPRRASMSRRSTPTHTMRTRSTCTLSCCSYDGEVGRVVSGEGTPQAACKVLLSPAFEESRVLSA